MRTIFPFSVSLLMIAVLGGCGTQIPDMKKPGQTILQQAFTEIDLVNHIKCELHFGTREAIKLWKPGGPAGGNGAEWLKKWQAKVNLKLTVDDTNSFNPGVTFTDPMASVISHFTTGNVTSPQNFSGTLGFQASAKATRAETVAFTYHLDDLLKYDPLKEGENCAKVGKVPIVGDLKISDFIITKTGISASPDTIPNDGARSPFNVFSYQTTFIVTLSGSANPVWRLVNVTANAGTGNNPLVSATRSRTQDITITMGPINDSDVAAVYQANLIGQFIQSNK
jgi:hypothetical protein